MYVINYIYLINKAILYSRNNDVENISEKFLKIFDGHVKTYLHARSTD